MAEILKNPTLEGISVILMLLMPVSLAAVVLYCYRRSKSDATSGKSIFILTAFMFLCIIFMNLSKDIPELRGLNPDHFSTAFFDVLRHLSVDLISSLKVVKMDEDLEPKFVNLIMGFVSDVTGDEIHTNIIGCYAYALCVAAPISCAATIIDVLTSFIPKLKLRLCRFKNRIYFSELNETSLALAESIVKSRKRFLFWRDYLLIFTEAYLDDESEVSADLHIRARKLGALCFEDDLMSLSKGDKKCHPLLHLNAFRRKNPLRRHTFFLMDTKEINNVRTLTEMCEKFHYRFFSETEIYVFYQDDAYALLEQKSMALAEKKVVDGYAGTYRGRRLKEQGLGDFIAKKEPYITRVRYFENIIFGLLRECPLVTPLLDRSVPDKDEEKPEFNVTVFGGGEIGRQMLLASSWCGQLYGYRLGLNMVSRESREDFVARINSIAPDFIRSTDPQWEELKIRSTGEERSAPYFTLRYCQRRLGKCPIDDIRLTKVKNPGDEKEDDHSILDSDYYLISLGKDDLNISVAEQLKIDIIKHRMAEGDAGKRVVIALAVYDANLCDMFNKNEKHDKSGVDKYAEKITMFAFGSVDDTYNYERITIVNNDVRANGVHAQYEKLSAEKKKDTRDKRKTKYYDSWSSIARDIHVYSRIFSSYVYWNQMRGSSAEEWPAFKGFEYAAAEEGERKATVYDEYYDRVISPVTENVEREIKQAEEKANEKKQKKQKEEKEGKQKLIKKGDLTVAHIFAGLKNKKGLEMTFRTAEMLTCLEHRRWNAYLRSVGFVHGNIKDTQMTKIHPCIVETAPADEFFDIYVCDRLDEYSAFDKREYKKYDSPHAADKELYERIKTEREPESRVKRLIKKIRRR